MPELQKLFKMAEVKNYSFIFNHIDIAYPQNKETRNYLKKLGVKNKFIGNLKFIDNEKYDIDFKLKSQLINQNLYLQAHMNMKKFFLLKLTYY